MKINIGKIKNSIPEHEHGFSEIIIFTEGSGFLQTNKKKIPFNKGTIVIVPPKIPHKSISNGDFERIFINERFDRLFNLSEPTVIQDDDGDGFVLAQLIYKNRYTNTEYLSSLLNSFIGYLFKAIEIEIDEVSAAIRSITNEITDNYFDCKIDLSSILKKSGYSEDYIRSQFKQKTGKTPVRFLTEIRIAHSCVLIDIYKGALSLSQIAEKCGYTDYVYFSRRFKEIKGMSPREYMHSDIMTTT